MKKLLLFILLSAIAISAQSYSGGAGTEASPYQIANKTDLKYLSEHSTEWAKYFIQTADITFASADFESGGDFYNSGAGFIPIGSSSVYFVGSYDGQEHSISNLVINRGSSDYIGLFGYVSSSGIIQNLKTVSVTITGRYLVGGLAGYVRLGATIERCSSTGTVNGNRGIGGLVGSVYSAVTIQYSYSSCTVTGIGTAPYNIGGLIGITDASSASEKVYIEYCYSSGEVSGYNWVGGLIGYAENHTQIQYSFSFSSTTASSSYAGGLIGSANDGTSIYHCYSKGAVTAQVAVGGLLGALEGTVTATSSYWDTQTSGQNTSALGTGKTTTQMKTQATYSGWDFSSTWGINGSINSGYPYLIDFYAPHVSTNSVTSITYTSASSGGNITSLGSSSVSAHGVCWSTSANPTTSNSKTNHGAATLGSFTSNLTGLSSGVTYYVRAYATNSYGTNYGSQVSFQTSYSTPTIQATNIIFNDVYSNRMIVGWTNGNGTKRVVFAKQASSGTTTLVDNTTYTASTTFGSGTEIATGWYCIYNGTGSNVLVTGLTSNTSYIFQVFEYNNTAGNELYLTSSASNNPKSQATSTTAPPNLTKALSFDGTNERVSTGYTGSIGTLEFWIKPNSLATSVSLFGQRYANTEVAGNWQMHWEDGTGKLRIYGYQPAGVSMVTASTFEIGKWYHIAVTSNGTNVTFYINGVYDSQHSFSVILGGGSNADSFTIGASGANSAYYYYNGEMDEVRVWSSVRTVTEIQENMCKKLSGGETGLIAYYPMNSSSGSTLTDNSSQGNNGTLVNMEDEDWVESGASIGDASICDYSSPVSVNLASAYGDDLTVNSLTGSPTGVQIYRIDGAANTTVPPDNMTDIYSTNYYGVFLAGGTNPTYSLVYNYEGHPEITDENLLALAYRADNSVMSWTRSSAFLDTDANTLTLSGQTGTQFILGEKNNNVENYALSFDGTNDYVQIPAHASLNMSSSNFTLETWIRSDATYTGWKVIIEHGASWTTGTYGLHSNGSSHLKVDFYGRAGTPAEVSISTDWTDGKWHHFAGVFDNDNNKLILYMDGIKVDEETETAAPGSAVVPLYINGRGGSDLFVNADMDEVRIWNVARTEAQIQANMCKKLVGNESGLVAYYQITDGSGTTLTDNSSNSNNGTLINMDNSDWITSGAAIGDVCTYDYSSPSSVNLASSYGDDVTVNSITGSPSGVQIYCVDTAPNVTTAPGNMTQLSSSHYFGVFLAGGTSPTYTFAYNYDGHPGISDESSLDLASRANNATTSWTETNATLDVGANTLTLTEQTGTEYILGSESANALPVELTSFSASMSDKNVILNWQTATEVKNYGFSVERAANLRGLQNENGDSNPGGFSTIGFVQGNGNSNSPKSYSFTDATPPSGKVQYRLKQIDFDGKFEYSKEVEVKIELPIQFKLAQNYPNPFNPETVISYELPFDGKVELKVYDLLGREVAELVNEEKVAGRYEVKLSVKDRGSNLSSGVYYYQLRAGTFMSTKKFVILK